MPPTRAAVLSLYRDLLRTVRTFPSKKRNSIREDIRVTMREGAALRVTQADVKQGPEKISGLLARSNH